MKQFLAKIYSIYALILFFIVLVPMFFIYPIVYLLAGKARMTYYVRINRVLLGLWAISCGIRVKFTGMEKIDKGKTYVITPNHCNMLDIPICAHSIIHNFRVLAKKELAKIPIFGQLISMTSILVNRANPESRVRSMNRMVNALKEGISLFIFPEGTRNRTHEPLKSFYDGAFRAAIEAQVPILPCVQLHYRDLQPVHTWMLYPGKIEFRVLDAIPTEGMTLNQVGELKNKVKSTILAVLLKDDNYWKNSTYTHEHQGVTSK
ncbi:MAG: lysophospholipid acyltransferase family protein [Bacteroidia bacterium]